MAILVARPSIGRGIRSKQEIEKGEVAGRERKISAVDLKLRFTCSQLNKLAIAVGAKLANSQFISPIFIKKFPAIFV